MTRKLSLALLTLITSTGLIVGDAADHLSDLVGYTIIAVTNVKGSFDGADYDKLVRLDNGWIFEFRTYHYHYAYHPRTVVFAKNIESGLSKFIDYKLLIDDDIYDVRSVK